MRVTILRPNVFSEFGIRYSVGSTQTVSDEYGRSLVSRQDASDTDGITDDPGNDPFLTWNSDDIQAPPAVTSSAANQIQYVSKISKLLNAISKISNVRTNIPFHGTSMIWGAGANDTSTALNTDVRKFRQQSMAAMCSKRLNAGLGGAFAPGIEPLVYSTLLSPIYVLGGTAAISSPYQTFGIGGYYVAMTGGSAMTITFSETTGDTVRIYAACSGTGAAIYTVNGGGNQTATAFSTASDVGTGTSYWYTFDIIGLTPGANTIVLKPSANASENWFFMFADFDAKASAGLTLHRAALGGGSIGTTIGLSLDNTDTQPAGNWIGSGVPATRRAAVTDCMTTRLGATGGVICSFDINDISTTYPASFGWTLTDLTRHANNYLAAMSARGLQVLFVTNAMRDPSIVAAANCPYTQNQIMQVYADVAAASTNAAFLDLTKTYGATATEAVKFAAQAATNRQQDEPHWNTNGHAFMGNALATAILNSVGQ